MGWLIIWSPKPVAAPTKTLVLVSDRAKLVAVSGGNLPQALLNAVVFGVQGMSERALQAVWSENRPLLTGAAPGLPAE